MRNEFMNAMDFRHACKVFDENKKISDEDIKYILEVGRKSPSSFGIEPWKFLVITNEELKAKLSPACFKQPQITTCSHLVIILASIENVKLESGMPEKMLTRWGKPKEELDFYMDFYKNALKDTLTSNDNIYNYSSHQAYIASANMLTAGAFIGIDSCPISGFNKEEVENILEIDASKYQLSLVIPFGYRVNEQPEQFRLSFDEIVEFVS